MGVWRESARWKPTYKRKEIWDYESLCFVITRPLMFYSSQVRSKDWSAVRLSLTVIMERDAYTRHHSHLLIAIPRGSRSVNALIRPRPSELNDAK